MSTSLCANCGRHLPEADEQAGSAAPCPSCGHSPLTATRSHAQLTASEEPTAFATVWLVPEEVPTRSFAGPSPSAMAQESTLGSRAEKSIGRYVIDRVLGEGAFGTVYLARDEDLRRPVAIKVPKQSRITTEADIEAYMAEARAVASLDHPAIVPVYDVGRTGDGRCYVVSKFIPGRDLAHRLQEGRPSALEAAAIVARAAEALDHAHQRGLIHRDIKPANLLLDASGNVYVADFGLALNREERAQDGPLAGTPAYMSPEQASGTVRGLDGRSDLFSLGVVFYELLTGQRPFRGRTWKELKEQILAVEPEVPRLLDGKVPNELSRICVKCLAKAPSDRYRGAHELATALRRWQKNLATGSGVGPDTEVNRVAQRIVPERFQPFAVQDADFYLDLLPGVRGGDHLPSVLRFWKSRLEETDSAPAFAVGLLTGPPGIGKTSIVKAGLLPRLADRIRPVYVVASAQDTKSDLHAALRRSWPGLPDTLSLSEAFDWVRDESGTARAAKTFIVLDQFERGLMGSLSAEGGLGEALARCDGRHLQCLLVVRESFRAHAALFLSGAGLPIRPGENEASAEAFDANHARQVLTRIGQAFRCLPEDPADISSEQSWFLDQAIVGLTQQERVRPLRLAQLALALKGMAWKPSSLSQIGGIPGSLAASLESSFSRSRDGIPAEDLRQAARAVLRALLPPEGESVAQQVRSGGELLDAAGRRDHAAGFITLLAILDEELRLITPVAPVNFGAMEDGLRTKYRLTEGGLATGVRQWLKLKPPSPRPGMGMGEDYAPALRPRPFPVSGRLGMLLGLTLIGATWLLSRWYNRLDKFPWYSVATIVLGFALLGVLLLARWMRPHR